MKKLILQIFKFGIVGILSFGIDYGLLIILTEVFHVYYFVSAGVSFTVSLIFNYLCNMRYVFKGREDIGRQKEIIIFVLLSLIGLGINQWMMWGLVEKASMHYLLSKVFATCAVMVWNFVTRKKFLEEKN